MFTPGRHNPVWKEWARIGKGRDSRFFLEHPEAVLESLERGPKPGQILLSQTEYERKSSMFDRLSAEHPQVDWYLLPDQKLNSLTSVSQAQGLCGVFSPSQRDWQELLELRFLLVGWELGDPGNVGTLIRTCRALTRGALLLVGGCNPWSSKVARASAGSLLRLPLARVESGLGPNVLEQLGRREFKLLATFPRRGTALREVAWGDRNAVFLGNESHGLPPEIQALAEPVSIPMADDCESLNVGVAGAIVAYEWQSRSS